MAMGHLPVNHKSRVNKNSDSSVYLFVVIIFNVIEIQYL